MKISIELANNILIIKDTENILTPLQLNQLDFWGFLINGESYKLDISDNESLINKTINYFKKNKIEFIVNDKLKEILESFEKNNLIFLQTNKAATDFKQGRINVNSWQMWNQFINNNITRELKKHQVKSSYHMYITQNAANFSVPGSGKTSVVLTVYENHKINNKVDCLFVCGPPSSFGPWKYEFRETLGKLPSCCVLAGAKKHERKLEYYKSGKLKDLYLITYHTFLNDLGDITSFFKSNKIMFVVDEAHYMKQLDGNWANAILTCSEFATIKCLLTGTPMPKGYSDLFNLFDFLWPNKIFNEEDKTKISILATRNQDEKIHTILNEKISPFFYRVRKKDLGLKPQYFEKITVKMNHYESIVYNAIFHRLLNLSRDEYEKNISLHESIAKGRMMRLRQSLSYTKLLSTSIEGYTEKFFSDDFDLTNIIYNYANVELPAKTDALRNIIKELLNRNEKVVIWSNFLGVIQLIEELLVKEKIYSKKIIGETPILSRSIEEEETREVIRNEFVDKESGLNVLLANPAACAESISLHTNCSHAIYYDLSFNCAQYLQSLDRIHRVGGSENKPSYYYFLQYSDTMENTIWDNIQTKATRMSDLIDNDFAIYELNMFDDSEEIENYRNLFLNKE